jgi:hypothetical protein
MAIDSMAAGHKISPENLSLLSEVGKAKIPQVSDGRPGEVAGKIMPSLDSAKPISFGSSDLPRLLGLISNS